MEEFKRNFVQNCKDYGVAPSENLLSVLKGRKKAERQSETLSLDFSGCNLAVQDCVVLAKSLSNDNNIEELRFSDCLLTEESCKVLLCALTSNRGVKKLDFKGNNIRASAEIVGRILKVTSTLTHLNLEWNGIGLWDTAVSSVAEGLQANQTLRYLDLRNNQITHEGGTCIADALKVNHVLKVLDLRWNNIGMLGAKTFLTMLKQNKEILKIEVAGNNIPSEMLKAVDSFLQRNVELQATCQEQKALTATYKQKLENVELQKNTQISSLVEKLAAEKDTFSSSVKSAQEKIEQLKSALEERKEAFSTLKEQFSATENSLRLAEQTTKRQEDYIDNLKQENLRRHQDMESTFDKLREQLALVEKTHKEALRVKANEITGLETKTKELESEKLKWRTESEDLSMLMKKREAKNSELAIETEKHYNREIENLRSESNDRRQSDLQKLKNLEQIQNELEDEISQLKSKLLSEKLRFEEDMMNMKMQLKQEELNRSRQFEERIEVLQASRNESQIKVTKQNADISNLQSRLANSEREAESLKRQCETLKQHVDNKDADLRNEASRSRLEIEGERRTCSQLRDRVAELESKLSDQEKRAKDGLASKDTEIAYLKNQIASRDDEISRNRMDEMKRTEMLENALQSYLSSARKAR